MVYTLIMRQKMLSIFQIQDGLEEETSIGLVEYTRGRVFLSVLDVGKENLQYCKALIARTT